MRSGSRKVIIIYVHEYMVWFAKSVNLSSDNDDNENR